MCLSKLEKDRRRRLCEGYHELEHKRSPEELRTRIFWKCWKKDDGDMNDMKYIKKPIMLKRHLKDNGKP